MNQLRDINLFWSSQQIVFIAAFLQFTDCCYFIFHVKDGNVKPFRKSEPIPEANNEPVKVIVADTLQEMFLKSGKNGMYQ